MSRLGRRVAIVAGIRTPFVKSGTVFRELSATDLGTAAVRELISRSGLKPSEIDHIVFGTVIQSVREPNIAREVGLRAGLSHSVPAFTVGRACASANQAITSAAEMIALGHAEVVIAGGAESLTNVPLLFSDRMRDAFIAASKARSLGARLRAFAGVRPRHLAPVAPAIAEPSTGLTMGQSAEQMAQQNGITREAQDEWAYQSHQRAWKGLEDGRLKAEIAPVYTPSGEAVTVDNGVRPDTSLEKLAKLRPVFDRQYGTITAGNASPLTDGASAVLLMSEEKAKALGLEPLGYIRSFAYGALSPSDQLLQGPVFAAPIALKRAGLSMKDIGLMEIHEAFAAQVLSNLQWLDSAEIARTRLGLTEAVGHPELERINVMGGSVAIGHPFGATGGRITTTLLNEMRRRGEQFGLLSVCAAGALGLVMVLERE